jgi:hypothetical protein
LIVDQHDIDALGVEPGCCDQRRRGILEQSLGLAVAQDGLGGRRLGRHKSEQQAQHQHPREAGQGARHTPASHSATERRMK